MDETTILAKLSTAAADDYVARVLQVYEAAMRVYEASERQYLSAIRGAAAVNGFSASTNAQTQ